MRTIHHVRKMAIALMALSFLAACRKDAAVKTSPTTPASNIAADAQGKVLTPFGMRDASSVHLIENGYHLDVSTGNIQKVENATGKVVAEYGKAGPVTESNTIATGGSNGILPYTQGWITDASWTNNTGLPITYFSTNWTVPTTPTNQSSQTLFLFNGLQDGLTSTSYIIQPVLQWGGSAAGGGQYWAIADWYVSSSQTFYTTPEAVSSGTNLQGVMSQYAVSGSSYTYLIYFAGHSALEIIGAPQATWAAETLETYGVSDPSTMYPPDSDVRLTNIDMVVGGSTHPSLSWATGQAVAGQAQKTVVVSNSSTNGEVDIYFR